MTPRFGRFHPYFCWPIRAQAGTLAPLGRRTIFRQQSHNDPFIDHARAASDARSL